MDKDKFSKRYRRMIERSEQQYEKDIGDWSNAPGAFYCLPAPRKRSDFKELKRQLRDLLKRQPLEQHRELTKSKLEEVEEALQAKNTRRALRWTIAVFIVAVVGVAATIYFGLVGG